MPLILPGMFEFAAPPRTGVRWFVEACHTAGLVSLPSTASVTASYRPWPITASADSLRVSLVRHPCHWFRSLYDSLRFGLHLECVALEQLREQFVGLRKESFESFALDYLEKMPGKITSVFDSYKSDIRIKLEDMPWALAELLNSLDAKKRELHKVFSLPSIGRLPSMCKSKWKAPLFDQMIEAEKQFCEDLDYY